MYFCSAERPRWRDPLMPRVQRSECQVSDLLPERLRDFENFTSLSIPLLEGPIAENFWRPLLTEHSLILSFWDLCVSCSFVIFFWGYWGFATWVTIAKVSSITFLPIHFVPQFKQERFFFGLAYDASNPRALLRSRFSLILLVPIL